MCRPYCSVPRVIRVCVKCGISKKAGLIHTELAPSSTILCYQYHLTDYRFRVNMEKMSSVKTHLPLWPARRTLPNIYLFRLAFGLWDNFLLFIETKTKVVSSANQNRCRSAIKWTIEGQANHVMSVSHNCHILVQFWSVKGAQEPQWRGVQIQKKKQQDIVSEVSSNSQNETTY